MQAFAHLQGITVYGYEYLRTFTPIENDIMHG